jgi:hypothetical protein
MLVIAHPERITAVKMRNAERAGERLFAVNGGTPLQVLLIVARIFVSRDAAIYQNRQRLTLRESL